MGCVELSQAIQIFPGSEGIPAERPSSPEATFVLPVQKFVPHGAAALVIGSVETAAIPAAAKMPEEPTATICGVIGVWPKEVAAQKSDAAIASGVANSLNFFIIVSPIGKSSCSFVAQAHFGCMALQRRYFVRLR